jgi:hypothetical protein
MPIAFDRYSSGTTCKSLSLEALGVVALAASEGVGVTTLGAAAGGGRAVAPVSLGVAVGWATWEDLACFALGFNFGLANGSDLSTHPTDIAEFELNKWASARGAPIHNIAPNAITAVAGPAKHNFGRINIKHHSKDAYPGAGDPFGTRKPNRSLPIRLERQESERARLGLRVLQTERAKCARSWAPSLSCP